VRPRDLLLGILVPFIWGFNFVVADDAVNAVPPFLLLALRYLAVGVIFLPFTSRGGIPWRHLAVISVLYGMMQITGLFIGLHDGVGAGIAGTILQSQALITILLARLVLGESFRRLQWGGLAAGMIGLVLVAASGGGNAPLTGVLWVLFGAVGWAGSNVVLKKYGPFPPWSLTVWQSIIVVPPMLLCSALFEHGQVSALRHISAATVEAVVYIAVLATGLANYLWYRLVQRVGPSTAAPFSLLVPVVSLLSAWLVSDQGLSPVQVVGVSCILLGVAAIALSPRTFPSWRPGRPVLDSAAATNAGEE
jgi:O-acetylserine/cysteine efflux transporter